METQDQHTSIQNSNKLGEWFENFISNVNTDRLMIETNTAPEHKISMYNDLADGRFDKILSDMRNTSSMYFIKELIWEYVSELKARKVSTTQLAFDLSDAKVLVWAEINDGDEESEDGLILAEAKINANFSNNGFHISSTIVEKEDNISVPPHYSSFKD